jgi:3-dehydroquinate synthase
MSTSISVAVPRPASSAYEIVIGMPLQRVAKNIPRTVASDRYFIITDSNVGPLYAEEFSRILEKNAKRVNLLVVKSGEHQKNRQTKERLEDAMLRIGADRSSVIITLGGGVIGDLGGFVASTFMRGIRYIHIPTSLLAQVDSSVGGKVAVNHPTGKNLIGAFHAPERVYIDVRTLQTLPEEEFLNGLAEAVKSATILDEPLFRFLEEHVTLLRARNLTTLAELISRCCAIKKTVVESDEREEGYRRILNFGHTIGHAIEQVSKYKIPHGKAVAIGMACEARMSRSLKLAGHESIERLLKLMKQYELPTEFPKGIKSRDIIEATMSDKKARDGKVHYTLLKEIGQAVVGHALTEKGVIKLLGS